jgi:uncharacterized protein YoxC
MRLPQVNTRPSCLCFPPVVIAVLTAIACLTVMLYDVRAVWAIEAQVEVLIRQNEQLTADNAKLRQDMAESVRRVRGQ